ncbi:MAG: ergothioneine biosynthesis protein EgtB [Proteobacteria bacterium]|nr:ergothioneine biosynthesis protein EgtB [Pseudomonadota bacterium]
MNFPARHLTQPDLARRFAAVRKATLALVEGLDPEDCALQSMPDASPAKWHLAHTTWFFETFVLERYAARHTPFRAEFREFYNSYYHAVGEQFPRAQRGLISRPGLGEVLAYREHVDAAMLRLLETQELPGECLALVELGFNHEQQHQELIVTDFMHLLSLNPFAPAWHADPPTPATPAAPFAWTAFEAGLAEIGHDGAGFAFDNEMPRHRQFVEAYELASRPVNNAEYLAFVEDGGYRRPELWLSEGWQTAQGQRWTAPIYWRKVEGAWQEFTLHGQRPLDPSRAVVHVSHYEADAYARWASARLPTEFEWERAAPLMKSGGQVWEWTSSSYAPYPGFRATPGAVGEYNGKFMANQYVLRGGSCATPAGHARATYRNFFPSAARWQFSGIRLARQAQ